jgi:putative toxin-antitoxin system antitoxin component (TIGR02293 family)
MASSTLQDGPSDEQRDSSTRVESPVAIYGSRGLPAVAEVMDHWMSVLQKLGIQTTAKAGSALSQIREILRAGLPREAFDRVRSDLGVSVEELADILGIPTRTLARRTDRFKPDESERLLRVGSVVHKALDVLEEKEAARRWMTQPKRALGGLTPLRCCDTEMGAREVEALLGRIEHGVFS